VGFALGANGDATALCTNLLSGPCSTASNMWPAGFTNVSTCVAYYQGSFGNGSDTDTNQNTIGCRQHYANLVNASDNSTWYNCRFASFVSGVCGTAVNNTCTAMGFVCAGNTNYPYASTDACYTDLTSNAAFALPAVWGSLQGVPGALENSLECRMYHALAGGITGGNSVHCGHVPSASSQCTTNVTVNPSHACGTVNLACTGASSQYNALAPQAMCVQSFSVFPVGPGVAPTNNNDQSSRQYHGQAAYINGGNNVHCAHAGPSGGGLLGGATGPRAAWQYMTTVPSCHAAPYAYLATSIATAFAAWNASDFLAIVPTDPNVGSYNATTAPVGNFDACRIYHLSVASVANSHCTHGDLLGGGQCPLNAPYTPACLAVQTACGTQLYPTQAACETAFTPYFSTTASPYFNNTMTGDPNVQPATGDTAQCRLYYAGTALAARNAGSMNNNATCANAAITGSVCLTNGMTPTPMKSDATPLALSAGVSLLMMLW